MTYNVKDPPFNAVGNGVANDTAAIAAALTAAASVSGAIYFPTGNYLVDNLTSTLNGALLYGDGSNSILTFVPGDTNALFTFNGFGGIISRIAFNGGDSTTDFRFETSPTDTRIGIAGKVARNLRIIECDVYGFGNVGITDAADAGSPDNFLPHALIQGNSVFQNFRGIDVGGEFIRIVNNQVCKCGQGIYSDAANQLMVGNIILDNGDCLTLAAASAQNGHGIVTGNIIDHSVLQLIHAIDITVGMAICGNALFAGGLQFEGSNGLNCVGNIISAANIVLSGGERNFITQAYFFFNGIYQNTLFHDFLGDLDGTVLFQNFQDDGRFPDSTGTKPL